MIRVAWKHEPIARSAATALMVACAACCSSPSYRGDGKITRRMVGADVDLGLIDFSKQGHYTFVMEGLSSCEMVVGFRTQQRDLDAAVRLRLANAKDEVVVDEQGALQTWVWEDPGFFVYRTGGIRELPAPGPSAAKIVHADGGWGTYFTPANNERYRLDVDVLQAAKVTKPEARLAVKCLKADL